MILGAIVLKYQKRRSRAELFKAFESKFENDERLAVLNAFEKAAKMKAHQSFPTGSHNVAGEQIISVLLDHLTCNYKDVLLAF
mmetsp:Transcript_22036/g.54517  ORF Transcript_22036/g.54517 Transcript_22036/m.54517 type:complete len:83 (-) Transcript_22036:154-402(-)